MSRKCFISHKSINVAHKNYIRDHMDVDMIDKSLHERINSENEDYIMRKIREDYLSDSTVTIFLIGAHSYENLGYENQRYIKRELQASLYHGEGNTKSGILGVVLPDMYNSIYGGSYTCQSCGNSHNSLTLNDYTVISEFGYNYFIPNGKCSWTEEDRYCVLVKWDDFNENANHYIEQAFQKRSSPISNSTKVRP